MTSLVKHSNSEAERAVLGAILLDNSVRNTVKEVLEPNDFYNSDNKKIYIRMLDMELVDLLTLTAALREDGLLESIGVDYIYSLEVPTSSGIDKYCSIIKELSVKRQSILAMTNMIADLNEGSSIDELNTFYSDMLKSTAENSAGDWVNLGEGYSDIMNRISDTIDGKSSYGIKTGFDSLDKATGGAKPGELWVIGACSSHGKTTMATQIAINAARQGKHVGFFSFEMNRETLLMYHASREVGIDYNDIVNGNITHAQNVKFANQMGQLKALNIDVYESSLLSPSQLVGVGTKKGFDLVLIDYLQRFSKRKGEGLRETITEGAKQSKTLAKELNAPVFLISSLTKDVARTPPRRMGQQGIDGLIGIPRKDALKESGDIEYEADTIVLLTIPSKSGNMVDESIGYWILDKQRTGPLATMKMTWDKHTWSNY